MIRDKRKLLKIIGFAVIGIIIVGYSTFQTRYLVQGPVLEIFEPENGETLEKPLIKISGFVKNVSSIHLNDNQIFVDEAGNFNEILLLSPGYNIIKVEVIDKFGRKKDKEIKLVYETK